MFYTNSAGLFFRLMETNRCLIYLITDFIHVFQNGVTFNKMTFSNNYLSKKALFIAVLVFLKVKIRKALHCNIVSLEDLLKLNNLCHLIRKFSNFSQLCLPLVNLCIIYMKRVPVFLCYTASFILAVAIVFCQSNLLWDSANGFVNICSVHNDFNATNDFIRFLNFTYSFVEVNVDVSYDAIRNLSELMNKSEPGSNGSNKNTILLILFLTCLFFNLPIKQKPDVRVKIIQLTILFFLGSCVRHLQHANPYHETNVCSRTHSFYHWIDQ